MLLLLSNIFLVGCIMSCNAATKKGNVSMQNPEQPVCNEWIHPDSVAYQSLGRRLTDIFVNAKTVKVYSLMPKETTTPDDYVVETPFVREKLIGKLTKDQQTVLCYNLISNGANYHNDSTLIVMSPYYPVIEFEFTKKKEVAHVIISLSDYSWSVKYDDKIQFHYNYASGTFIKRFCNFFLKDNE